MFAKGNAMPLSYINKIFKAALVASKVAVPYTLHSMRRGGAQLLQEQEVDDSHVRLFGGWRSSACLTYMRDKSLIEAASAFKRAVLPH